MALASCGANVPAAGGEEGEAGGPSPRGRLSLYLVQFAIKINFDKVSKFSRGAKKLMRCRFSPAATCDENAGGRRHGNGPAGEFVPSVLRLAKAVAPPQPMSATLLELERVHVAVRRRPPFSREATHLSALRMEPPQSGELARVDLNESSSVSGGGVREYRFDAVFDYGSKQKELYVKMGRPIVASALAGVNGCVLAYGQTGAGKTYTVVGEDVDVIRGTEQGAGKKF